jgi:hypothetical protein
MRLSPFANKLNVYVIAVSEGCFGSKAAAHINLDIST